MQKTLIKNNIMQDVKEIFKNQKVKKFDIKKTSQKQKDYIQGLKNKIIFSNSYYTKYKNYLILVKYLKKIFPFKPPIYKHNIKIDYKIANKKISAYDTIIYSISPALICYSAIKGYCQLYKNKRCYALKSELQYNTSVLFKHRQFMQFRKMKAWQLARAFIKINKINKGRIKYLRLNESGEIEKKHMQKINKISQILKKYKIKVYTYTHNKEISKSDITSKNLVINSSHKNIKLSNRFLSYDKAKNKSLLHNKKNKKLFLCKADCSKCSLCKNNKGLTILCNIH